jgi:hypothetical protein
VSIFTSGWREIMKIRAEVNEIETKKTIQQSRKQKFFEKINKMDKLLAKMTK